MTTPFAPAYSSTIGASRKLSQSYFAALFLLIALFSLFIAPVSYAKDYTFTWDANPEPLDGYKLYYKKGGTAGPPFNGTDSPSGPSPISTGKVTTFTVAGLDENATYHFALTAYYGTDQSVFSDIVTISPDTPIEPTAVITPMNQTGQAPFAVVFDASNSTGSIDSYAWSFGDGDIASGASVSHTYQNVGEYTASLTVSNASGGSAQATVTISVTAPETPEEPPAPPVAIISSSSSTGYAPLTVQFNGVASSATQPATISSYAWIFGDGSAAASGVQTSHTYTVAGYYSVSLTVTDSTGLTNQTTLPIVVDPAPDTTPPVIQPVASFQIAATPVTNPYLVTLSASAAQAPGITISEYLWDFGDGTQQYGATVQHTYSAAGTYTITLRVTSSSGATTTTTQTIQVKDRDSNAFPAIMPALMILLLQ